MNSKAWPDGIDPQSGCRLALPDRDSLDDRGKRALDRQLDPVRGSLAGLHGPFGIRIHSPVIAEQAQTMIEFFRHDSLLDARIREVAILVTARMHDSRFEWAAHEPAATKAGVPQDIIEAIRHSTPVDPSASTDELVVALGRQLFGERRVAPDLYDAALEAFGARGLVELVTLMAMYAGTASLLAAFDTQLPPGAVVDLP